MKIQRHQAKIGFKYSGETSKIQKFHFPSETLQALRLHKMKFLDATEKILLLSLYESLFTATLQTKLKKRFIAETIEN